MHTTLQLTSPDATAAGGLRQAARPEGKSSRPMILRGSERLHSRVTTPTPLTTGGTSMSKTVLIVGTRKGCFLFSSDERRRDWEARGPFCEGWPVYHAIHDARTGAILAAAASEWHGASIWRSPDLGETWQQSSEGLDYAGDPELKLSKVSGLTAVDGR
ncbi:MAG TPA: hypothetical protein VFR43_12025, partial [Gaiellaceae bacterium]|nr:hypothetical protein [Gaiellaceae bacterium]